MAQLNPEHVKKALNDFRDLMKICFKKNIVPDTNLSSASYINLSIDPSISIDILEVNTKQLLAKDIGSTFKDIKHLDDFLKIIKISEKSLNTYISVDNFSINSIKSIIESSDLVTQEYKDYLAYLIFYYYYLIILCGIGCISDIANSNLYHSYILHMTKYIEEIRNIDNITPINNYISNKDKVTKSSNAFIEQKHDNKKILDEIKDYDGFLSYVYIYLYFIITLLLVIVIFCIVFKNNNIFLIGILILLIIINALFSKYLIVIEQFNTINVISNEPCELKKTGNSPNNLQKIEFHLCQVLRVTYERLKKNDLPIIDNASIQLITENKLYKNLYAKVKNLNINTKDTINLNLLSFYQSKEYVNLFMRLLILVILLLILYNIFGFNYIIVILGMVLFSLIFMIYLYNIKKISRTNYKNINWNHTFKFN
jgi:hypothetical protein